MIEIYLKAFLRPRQILNKSMKSHEHCAFIIEGSDNLGGGMGLGFGGLAPPPHILEAESSLIKPQLQMAVGTLMEKAHN